MADEKNTGKMPDKKEETKTETKTEIKKTEPEKMDMDAFIASYAPEGMKEYAPSAMKESLKNDPEKYKTVQEWEKIFNKLFGVNNNV